MHLNGDNFTCLLKHGELEMCLTPTAVGV
ncbi:hypothetical protein STPYR_12622 [uncultured Stenotrophomonas sp.]|uniref:Uncharacterized protein n=1 Tax=uncultured Stenotrophomonas sp. TaxID=165438 RepID=A0A1Y5Q5V8_9GAMM|nr:hypothetical protein STPYR_12622 [uncultured Stenotrophomonas sp.]